jgi:hypothetical protein
VVLIHDFCRTTIHFEYIINKNPVEWWGTQHTNFGMIEDKTSLEVVDSIFDQPTKSSGGMTMLVDPIHFDLRLEKEV